MALLIAGKPGLEAYLNRIKFLGSTTAEPTLANLALLHKCHTMNIPFENLIFNHHKMKGTERPVDIDSLHSRIVQRRRGGMCQEMNTLLKHHLQQLGYDCYSGLAAVVTAGSQQPAAEPFEGLVTSHNLGSTQKCDGTHQIILTKVDDLWYLCDVGFGGQGLVAPVLLRAYDDVDAAHNPTQQQPPADWLEAHGEYLQAGTRFRLRRGVLGSAELLSAAAVATHPEKDSFVGYYLQAQIKEQWIDQYWFSLVPVSPAVLQACAEHSFRRHPLFTQHMVVVKPVEDGRITLMDFTLKTRRLGQPTEERVLQSEEERDQVLAEVFDIDLEAYP